MLQTTASTTHEFSVRPSEITVNRTLIEGILGYHAGAVPAVVSHFIDEILPLVPRHVDIRCGFTILPSDTVRIANDSLLCDEVHFATGPIIAKQLRKARTLALYAATVGPGLERWSKELMAGSDMVKGYIVDAVGSEVVEQTADWLEKKVAETVGPLGWSITNRYSPGYCGWSVAEQHKLFSFLPEGFCGITLTEMALMIPIKSVSGVIGLGPKLERGQYQCSICDMKDCFRRREDTNEDGC